MGCCLIAILLWGCPRLALFVLWISTNYAQQVWHGWGWPILGFIFMPYTTLAYMGAIINTGKVDGLWFVLLIFAVIFDIGQIKIRFGNSESDDNDEDDEE